MVASAAEGTTQTADAQHGTASAGSADHSQAIQQGLEMFRQKLQDITNTDVAKSIGSHLNKAGRRAGMNELYTTLEDFQRAEPEMKRVVLIGCTGAGKSTIGNIAAGWRLKGRSSDDGEYHFDWKHPEDAPPLFEARADGASVTSKTSFANIHWLGDKARPALLVDTPGHDDTAAASIDTKESRDKLGALAADLHNKLKALGCIHTIVIIHNDVMSNRLNPATQTVLKMVGEKFAKAESSVWKNVVIAYSKCNEHESSWKAGLKEKKSALQKLICELSGTSVEVPIVTLGGAEAENGGASGSATKGYDELWKFVDEAVPLDTTKLQPFEGSDIKWQKLINAKDEAEALAAAAVSHMMVVFKLSALCGFLFWRAMLLPTFLGLLFLNLPATAFDELAILLFFVFRMGPTHVRLSLQHFSQQLILPYVRGPLTNACNVAEMKLRAAGIEPLADAALAVSKAVAEPKKKAD